MIVPVAALAAALVPLVLGGRASRLAALRLRRWPWLLLALLAQVVVMELASGPHGLLAAAHVATYGVALWVVVANRRVPGLLVLGLGAALNGLVIALNGGVMPVDPGALAAAGLVDGNAAHGDDDGSFVNSGVVAEPRAWFLGDVVPVPGPLANVVSVGDLLVVGGVGVTVWRVAGTRWTHPWTPDREMPAPTGRAVRAGER